MRIGMREIVFFLLLAALPVGLYYGEFKNRLETMDQMAQAREQREARLVQVEAAMAHYADLGEEAERLAGAIAIFEQKLPEEKEVEVVLGKVWELAIQHRLKPKNVRTAPNVNEGRFSKQPIHMTIVGDFLGFYDFLKELEKLDRVTQLNVMKLKKIVAEEEGLMQADVVLNIYFEPRRNGGRS